MFSCGFGSYSMKNSMLFGLLTRLYDYQLSIQQMDRQFETDRKMNIQTIDIDQR